MGGRTTAFDPNLMLCAINDLEFCEMVGVTGPKYVAERFGWIKVVDRLLPIILSGNLV